MPQSIVYDNDRCLVAKVLPDGKRKQAALFIGFLSHYLIRDRYGRPGKGNDKGGVAGLVGYARRNLTVPIPQFRHGICSTPGWKSSAASASVTGAARREREDR